jgi:hypothetical protein
MPEPDGFINFPSQAETHSVRDNSTIITLASFDNGLGPDSTVYSECWTQSGLQLQADFSISIQNRTSIWDIHVTPLLSHNGNQQLICWRCGQWCNKMPKKKIAVSTGPSTTDMSNPTESQSTNIHKQMSTERSTNIQLALHIESSTIMLTGWSLMQTSNVDYWVKATDWAQWTERYWDILQSTAPRLGMVHVQLNLLCIAIVRKAHLIGIAEWCVPTHN